MGQFIKKIQFVAARSYASIFEWDIRLYTYRYDFERYKRKLNEILRNRDVLIVGSGPSLDQFDYSTIKHTVVIFLNFSFLKHTEFDETNEFLCVISDSGRINELLPILPKNIRKILIPNRLKNYRLIKKHLFDNDIIFIPRFTLSMEAYWDIPSLKPKKIFTSDIKLNNFLTARPLLLPSNVFLSALSLVIGYEPRKVGCIGVDLPDKAINKKFYTYASGLSAGNANTGFDRSLILPLISELISEAQSSNIKIDIAIPE